MTKKILFTGASGFSGSSLTKNLEEKNFKITKIIFKSTRRKNTIKIDLTKKIKLKQNFNWIIHAAGHHKIKDFKNKPKQKAKKNILMVQNLINFIRKNKVENFIYFSTIDINYLPYPTKKKIYCASKNFCEKILLSALKRKLLKKLIILRLPSIVNKKGGENFIKNTLHKLKKNLPITVWNKNAKFNNLIHINDLGRLIIYLISQKDKRKKIIIDCLPSIPIKLINLISYLKKELSSKSEISFIRKKNKFKKVKFNPKIDYKFLSTKKSIDLLI